MTVTGCHFALANGLCKGLGQAPLLTSKGCESLLANTQPRAENRKPKTENPNSKRRKRLIRFSCVLRTQDRTQVQGASTIAAEELAGQHSH